MKRVLSQFNMFETDKPMSGDKVNLDGSIECEFDEKIKINKYMEIRYRDAYHILNSGQIELFIRDENLRKKVLYTGDIGNTCIPNKPFLRPFFPIIDTSPG